MTKRSPEKIARLREMAEDGATAVAIGRALGVTGPCVALWAAKGGIKLLTRSQAMKKLHADPAFAAANSARMKKLHADPAFAAANSARMKKRNADPAFRQDLKASRMGAKGVKVPLWVPEDLHDEFLETAAASGEEDAARHIRRLKADMREGAFA